MHGIPQGFATDLAVLRLTGSAVDDRGDHLIVRTPQSPRYHWGNFVLVTDPAAVDDAPRWEAVFADAFPDACWVAIGLPRAPEDVGAWAARGLELDVEEVLATRALPRESPCPDGYCVRRIEGDDWDRLTARAIAENDRLGEHAPESYARFAADRTATQRDLSERGVAAFFGAFSGDTLGADLGVVLCGTIARYQNVGTDAAHRRRGLATHLLGVAARWAADRGCDEWVIVTETTNPAGRVYRSVGFEPALTSVQAYRRPPLPAATDAA